jgi:hypothetical protein
MSDNDARPVIVVAVGDDGRLSFQVSGFNPIELWGIAEQIKRFGDELAFQQTMANREKKPRLVIPG